ncbi:MAG: aldo/keto reductase [Clostridia bacterium]
MKYYEPVEGLRIPSVAMGCMRIVTLEDKGLDGWIDSALECGANFFDHADIYEDEGVYSEERFGKALARRPSLRERMTLQSKCGICSGFYDSSSEHIIKSVEVSLKRLHTDYLDVLEIHRPDVLADVNEIAGAFSMLEKSGKVRYFGVSNHNVAQLELLQKACQQKLIFSQMQLGLMHSRMIDQGINANTCSDAAIDRDGGMLAYCNQTGRVLQAWSPFQYGDFEGVFIDNPKFPALNEKLRVLSEKYGVSKMAVAVAWILRIPAMVQTILGTTSLQRMKQSASGADFSLERQEWYALYRAAGNQLL